MMKTLLIALASLSAVAARPATSPIIGTWTLEFERDANDVTKWEPPVSDCTFEQTGARLTGTCGSDKFVLSGAVKGRNVTFELRSDQTAKLNAQLDDRGTVMTGTWQSRSRFGRFRARKHQQ
ncbi:MAG TPA: hypothetical protein VG222_18265 [Vicinamibacterales bacterium]|nr:hypothetical protein [Vicinamibacterales bacterium]